MNNQKLHKIFYDHKEFIKLAKYINNNKVLLQASFQNQPVEHMTPTSSPKNSRDYQEPNMMSLFFLFFIGFVIWIWALFVTLKYWNEIPVWARIISLVCLVSGIGGPIVSIIVVYVAKDDVMNSTNNPLNKLTSFI